MSQSSSSSTLASVKVESLSGDDSTGQGNGRFVQKEEGEESANREEGSRGSVTNVKAEEGLPREKRLISQEGDEEEILLPVGLASVLQPHQLEGVKFCWKTVATPKKSKRGCILAHSMGLGKTLQMVTFTYLFIKHNKGKCVLILAPKSTLLNWQHEFDMKWSKHFEQNVHIKTFIMEDRKDKNRKDRWKKVKKWTKKGGALFLSYEMFRGFVADINPLRPPKKPKSADWHKYHPKFKRALFEQTDLIICDEGHKIKNPSTALSQVIGKIQTRNRMVLTGTPLQNHLMEYYTMIDFVRPELWDRNYFASHFASPIENGLKADAPPKFVEKMKNRMYELIEKVKTFIDRRDQSILRDSLPRKTEFVVLFNINKYQSLLYRAFLSENYHTKASTLFMCAILGKIVNHPDLLIMYAERQDMIQEYLKAHNERNESASAGDQPDTESEPNPKRLKVESIEGEEGHMISPERNSLLKTEVIEIESDDDCMELPSPNVHDEVEVESDTSVETENTQRLIRRDWRRELSSISSDSSDSEEDISVSSGDEGEGNKRKRTMTNRTTQRRTSRANSKRGSGSNSKRNGNSVDSSRAKKRHNDDDHMCNMYDEDDKILEEEIEEQITWDWLLPVLKPNYVRNLITRSPKMEFLIRLIEKCYKHNEKILVFSMYTEMLTLMENVVSKRSKFQVSANEYRALDRKTDYFRLDGQVGTSERQRMIDEFNQPDSSQRIFFISITAGSLGINLTSATRVVLFDVPWVPAISQQAIFRAYRYGQTKPVYIYRLVSAGTVENRIFNRCVLKTCLFKKVVDKNASKRVVEQSDLELFHTYLNEFTEQNLLNSQVYKDDKILGEVLGTGHVPEGTHRLAPVDIIVDATQKPSTTTSSSSASTREKTTVKPELDQEAYMAASEEMQAQLVQEEAAIGELDVKSKIVAVFHHESLFIDDARERISDAKQLIEAEKRSSSFMVPMPPMPVLQPSFQPYPGVFWNVGMPGQQPFLPPTPVMSYGQPTYPLMPRPTPTALPQDPAPSGIDPMRNDPDFQEFLRFLGVD